MIRFTCECGKQLQAREENAGQQAICPGCGRRQIIPATGADAIQPAEAAPPATGTEQIQRRRPTLAAPPEDASYSPDVGTSGKAITSLILGILSVLCNILTAVPAILVGLFALRDIGRSRDRLAGRGLAIAGIVSACVGTGLSCVLMLPLLLLPAVQKVREAAARVQSQNNLKQLSLAMHNYNSMYGRLPAAAICDPNGKPLLSWRVALLPYLGEQNLYSQFKLDEPWDSPNNIRLLDRMPRVYQMPSDPNAVTHDTFYQVFVGNGAAFEKTRGLSIPQDFPDGTMNVILIVEAGQAVPWTKPDDLPFDPNRPLPPLGNHFSGGFNAAGADGSVHFIPKSTPEPTLRQLITRNDGMPVMFP
jgi:hypothetical protein